MVVVNSFINEKKYSGRISEIKEYANDGGYHEPIAEKI